MQIFVSILLAIVWSLALPVCSQAEVVGHFLKVEGPVDLLKHGKLPVQAPKVKDGVEPGDVIRTKIQGRAQVKFVDESVLTIAPGSRVALETYMYDAAKGTRKVVLQVFRGMVQTAVTQIFATQEPDFIMKTHTAILGVRGAKWYALLGPNATDVYNESGKLSVRNIFPEIPGEIILNVMEFSRIMTSLAPTAAMPFQRQDLAPLEKMLLTGDGIAMPPGTLGGPLPFAFLDQPGFLSLQSLAADPQSPFYRPPQLLPPAHISSREAGPRANEPRSNNSPGLIGEPLSGIRSGGPGALSGRGLLPGPITAAGPPGGMVSGSGNRK